MVLLVGLLELLVSSAVGSLDWPLEMHGLWSWWTLELVFCPRWSLEWSLEPDGLLCCIGLRAGVKPSASLIVRPLLCESVVAFCSATIL